MQRNRNGESAETDLRWKRGKLGEKDETANRIFGRLRIGDRDGKFEFAVQSNQGSRISPHCYSS